MGVNGCGICNPREPPEKWTCPCGLGYFDSTKQMFITGDLVRSGKARTKAEFLAHVKQCPKCLPQAKIDTAPLQQYFIPSGGIDREVIENQIELLLGPRASVTPGDFDGKAGYLVLASSRPTVEMICRLKDLSLPKQTTSSKSIEGGRQVQKSNRGYSAQSPSTTQSYLPSEYQSSINTDPSSISHTPSCSSGVPTTDSGPIQSPYLSVAQPQYLSNLQSPYPSEMQAPYWSPVQQGIGNVQPEAIFEDQPQSDFNPQSPGLRQSVSRDSYQQNTGYFQTETAYESQDQRPYDTENPMIEQPFIGEGYQDITIPGSVPTSYANFSEQERGDYSPESLGHGLAGMTISPQESEPARRDSKGEQQSPKPHWHSRDSGRPPKSKDPKRRNQKK